MNNTIKCFVLLERVLLIFDIGTCLIYINIFVYDIFVQLAQNLTSQVELYVLICAVGKEFLLVPNRAQIC